MSIFTEPGTILAVFVGVSPYIGYQLFQFTPAGRRRKAEQDMREAQERSDEIKELEKIQKQHAALAAAKKAAEQSRLEEIAREEQSRLDEIAREKTRQMNESLEWISVRTWGENVLVKGPMAERHRSLPYARRALEGGLFFDRADLSIEERLRIEKKKRAHDPVGPRIDGSAWSQEVELWALYKTADRQKMQLALESTHSKCHRCGRPVSVQNKVEAMALLARTFELPEELYWRQAIANAMWHNKRWKIEPSDLLHSKTSPLSAAARHHAWINTVDTSDLNSPYPYWAYSQAGAEGLLANFWNEGEKFSEENWEAASRLAAAAPLIDDCLDCVTRAAKLKRSRVQFSPREREAVLMRDGFRCRNCGRSPREDGIKLHVDHIEPWSKGGTNDLENLQALCEECNLGKSDQEIV